MQAAARTKTKPAAIVTLGDVTGVAKKAYLTKRVRLIGCEKPITLPGWGQSTAVIHPVTIFDAKRFGNPKLGLVQLTGMFDDGGRCMAFLSANTVVELAEEDAPAAASTTLDPKEVIRYSAEVAAARSAGLRGGWNQQAVGADPEIFVVKGDGSLFAAFEFLPDHETALKQTGARPPHARGFGYHPFWDGYQAEFNVQEDFCIAFMVDSIRQGLAKTLSEARKKDSTAKLSLKTTMDVPLERLATDDRRYVQFGCTPSLNVYPDESFPDVDSATIPFRSAGGHIHFSCAKDPVEVVKGLDRVLGVIAVSMFQYYDDARRRILYGRAGEYRKTPYGLEYRVLSNAWLVNPIVTNMVYELARRVMLLGNWTSWQATEKEVRECINNCDVGLAHTILNRNLNQLHALVADLPSGAARVQKLVKVIFDGVHTAVKQPDELSVNWDLEGKLGTWRGHAESHTNALSHWSHHNTDGFFD